MAELESALLPWRENGGRAVPAGRSHSFFLPIPEADWFSGEISHPRVRPTKESLCKEIKKEIDISSKGWCELTAMGHLGTLSALLAPG